MTAMLLLAMMPAADPVAVSALTPEIPSVARPTYYPGPVFDLSADGKTLISGFQMESHKQFLRLWDLESGVIVNDLPLGTFEQVTSAKFAPDGKTIAVGLGERRGTTTIRLIDARNGALIREFSGFAGTAIAHGFSADGAKLITLDEYIAGRKSFKPQLITWNVNTAEKLTSTDAVIDHTLPTATTDGSVRAKFGPNREIIITRDGKQPFTIPNTKGANYQSLFLTPDGKRVIAGTHAWAEVYDTTTGEKVRVIRPDTQTVAAVAHADGGKLLFVALNSGRLSERTADPQAGWVCIWDTTKPELKTVIPTAGSLWKLQPSADGKRFVTINGDGSQVDKIEVWDTETKKRLHTFEVPASRQSGQAVVSPDARWVAHVSWDADKPTLRLWNAETGKPAEEVAKAIGIAAGSVAFTPDSKRLITVAAGGYAEWDLATGKKETEWQRNKKDLEFLERFGVGSVTALPGGKGVLSLAATQKRRQSYVLRLLTEKKEWFLGEFWDHASPPTVSADGHWLASIAGNAYEGQNVFMLRLDDDGSPELMKKPERYYGVVFDGDKVPAWRRWEIDRFSTGISFSPDGKRLYTGGMNHAVQVWDTASHELKATLHAVQPAKPGDTPADWVVFTPAGYFASSAGGEKVLRFRDATVETWFGLRPRKGTVPAAEMPKLRDPEKVADALTGK